MEQVARRAVDALPNITGTVLVRDRCGRADVVDAVLAECRARGLDPIVEHVSNEQLRAIIGATPLAALERWDRDRAEQAESVNGLIVLGGWLADLDGLPESSVAAWAAAIRRLELELERRNVPTVVVAVPTEYVAQRLGIGLPELEACVLPALLLSADALHEQVAPLVSALERETRIQVVTDAGTLALDRGRRPLMIDDGVIDDADVASGAVVSNLPAGSIYCTVIEDATRGSVALTDNTVLQFDSDGRVAEGPYAGERVSHLGIAVNPLVTRSIGWTIVDEHRPGAVFLALGENRYMGGNNESAINVDLMPAAPTVVVDDDVLVDKGDLAIDRS